MRRLPRPIAIPLAGLVCGVIGAAVFSALGGVVAGEKSCDIIFSVDGTASLLGTAMFIGLFGGVVGLAVGGLIAGVGLALSARQNLMAVDAIAISAVVAAGDGPLRLLGSVSFNSAIDHERCISGALLGGFVGATLGMLVGIQLASKSWSPRPLLASFVSVGMMGVLGGLLLWRYVGWTP